MPTKSFRRKRKIMLLYKAQSIAVPNGIDSVPVFSSKFITCSMAVISLFLLGGCIFIDPNETSSVKGTWTGTARRVAVYDEEGNRYEAISLDDAIGPTLPDR